jgi:hypothetical protein
VYACPRVLADEAGFGDHGDAKTGSAKLRLRLVLSNLGVVGGASTSAQLHVLDQHLASGISV